MRAGSRPPSSPGLRTTEGLAEIVAAAAEIRPANLRIQSIQTVIFDFAPDLVRKPDALDMRLVIASETRHIKRHEGHNAVKKLLTIASILL